MSDNNRIDVIVDREASEQGDPLRAVDHVEGAVGAETGRVEEMDTLGRAILHYAAHENTKGTMPTATNQGLGSTQSYSAWGVDAFPQPSTQN